MTGLVIENAAQEMVKTGPKDSPEWKPKYTMGQLLDPDFRLPTDDSVVEESSYDDFVSFFEGSNVRGLKN